MARQGCPRYYLIRYADDWVILTTSPENALKIKELAKQFLERNGRLELSEEKTLITNVRTASLTFLGTETRVRPSRKGKGLVTYSRPSRKALSGAVQSLKSRQNGSSMPSTETKPLKRYCGTTQWPWELETTGA